MASLSRRTKISPSKVSAIFFDLDNTLIQTKKGDKQACDKLVTILREQHSVPHDHARVASRSFLHNFRRCPDNGEMLLDDWRHLLWAQALGEEFNHLAESVYRQWLQLRYHFLAITPEVQALLCNLRRLGYRLGLITNGPSRAQWEKVRLLKLEVFFDIILVSGDLPWEKPEASIFLKACSFLRVEPAACLMVGDKLETDILGGRILGATVWVKPNEMSSSEFHPAKPDYTLRDVTEMARILQLTSTPDLEDCNSNASDGS